MCLTFQFGRTLFQILLSASILHLSGSLGSAKTLTVLLLANASTQDVIQNFLKEYSRSHPGIDFNVSIVQYSALTAKINTLVTAGEPPDVLEVTTAYIQTYAEQALDLAQFANGADLLNRYLPSYLHQVGRESNWHPDRGDGQRLVL